MASATTVVLIVGLLREPYRAESAEDARVWLDPSRGRSGRPW